MLEELLYGTLLRLNAQNTARSYNPGAWAPDVQRGPCGLEEDEPGGFNWRLRPEIKMQQLNELVQPSASAAQHKLAVIGSVMLLHPSLHLPPASKTLTKEGFSVHLTLSVLLRTHTFMLKRALQPKMQFIFLKP